MKNRHKTLATVIIITTIMTTLTTQASAQQSEIDCEQRFWDDTTINACQDAQQDLNQTGDTCEQLIEQTEDEESEDLNAAQAICDYSIGNSDTYVLESARSASGLDRDEFIQEYSRTLEYRVEDPPEAGPSEPVDNEVEIISPTPRQDRSGLTNIFNNQPLASVDGELWSIQEVDVAGSFQSGGGECSTRYGFSELRETLTLYMDGEESEIFADSQISRNQGSFEGNAFLEYTGANVDPDQLEGMSDWEIEYQAFAEYEVDQRTQSCTINEEGEQECSCETSSTGIQTFRSEDTDTQTLEFPRLNEQHLIEVQTVEDKAIINMEQGEWKEAEINFGNSQKTVSNLIHSIKLTEADGREIPVLDTSEGSLNFQRNNLTVAYEETPETTDNQYWFYTDLHSQPEKCEVTLRSETASQQFECQLGQLTQPELEFDVTRNIGEDTADIEANLTEKETGEPIPNAEIEIYGTSTPTESNQPKTTITTNENGTYTGVTEEYTAYMKAYYHSKNLEHSYTSAWSFTYNPGPAIALMMLAIPLIIYLWGYEKTYKHLRNL